MNLKKKGSVFGDLQNIFSGLAIIVIITAVCFVMLAQARTQVEEIENNTSVAYNATLTLTESAADIPDWIPIIVVASIGLVLFGLIATYRMGK